MIRFDVKLSKKQKYLLCLGMALILLLIGILYVFGKKDGDGAASGTAAALNVDLPLFGETADFERSYHEPVF